MFKFSWLPFTSYPAEKQNCEETSSQTFVVPEKPNFSIQLKSLPPKEDGVLASNMINRIP